MTALLIAFFLAAQAPPTLAQVKSEPNLERRARAAIDYSAIAEHNAETAYAKGDAGEVTADLAEVSESMRIAQDSLTASGKKPGKAPGLYKYAELHSRDLLNRLRDLGLKMDADEREAVDKMKANIQEIHDAWFEGIMGRSK